MHLNGSGCLAVQRHSLREYIVVKRWMSSTNIEQVGHDTSSLTEERTLESLYINPILDVLKRQNPRSRFVTSPTNK